MESRLLFLLLVLSQTLLAQTFTEVTGTPFDDVSDSSIAFSDVDGDGDDDVLITGENNLGMRIAKLYTNEGGIFTEVSGTPFDGVEDSSIAFSDVDGDGDNDVLITGKKGIVDNIAKLYINDGDGIFTEFTGTPFEGVEDSSIAFSDVDGDGDNDVLITGENSSSDQIAKLYINDGDGIFTEVTETPFEGAEGSSVAFSDVDGDGDNDVLMAGHIGLAKRIAKLYINDGAGIFTEVIGTPFVGVSRGSIAFSDVDGDGDKDVLITGYDGSPVYIAKLYINDGGGTFTEVKGTPFEGVSDSSIAFSDVNGDGDDDVLITGRKGANVNIANLYVNDGGGIFTEVTSTPFVGVFYSFIAFSDVDGDGDDDVLITGLVPVNEYLGEPTTQLYTNDRIVSSTDDLKNGYSLEFLPFPNPSNSSTISIQYIEGEIGEATIKVYNLNGVLLQQQEQFLTEGQQILPINIKSLNAGVYLIELHVGNKSGTAKLIVQ